MNIKFVNCIFSSDTSATLTNTIMELGDAAKFVFEGCYFFMSDSGVTSTTFTQSRFSNCIFEQFGPLDPTKLRHFLSLGAIQYSLLDDCQFKGYAAKSVIKSTTIASSVFRRIYSKSNVLALGSGGDAVFDLGSIQSSEFTRIESEPAIGSDRTTPVIFLATNFFGSQLSHLKGRLAVSGIVVSDASVGNDAEEAIISNCILLGTTLFEANSRGITLPRHKRVNVCDNFVQQYRVGYFLQEGARSVISDNHAAFCSDGFDFDGSVNPITEQCKITGNQVSVDSLATGIGFNMKDAESCHMSSNHVAADIGAFASGFKGYDLTGSVSLIGGHITTAHLAGYAAPTGFTGDLVSNTAVSLYNTYLES